MSSFEVNEATKDAVHMMNEILQEELRQKNEVLAASNSSYATLKHQYEELLSRLTEIRLENRSIDSPPPSKYPPRGKTADYEIEQLRAKIERKNKKNSQLLLKQAQLEKENADLKEKLESIQSTNKSFQYFVSTMGTEFPPKIEHYADHNLYLIDTLNYVLSQNQIAKKESHKANQKIRSLLKVCEKMAREAEENNKKLQQFAAEQEKEMYGKVFDHELGKIEKWISHYN